MWGKSPDMRGSILPSPSQIPLETPAHHHVPPPKGTHKGRRFDWWSRTGPLVVPDGSPVPLPPSPVSCQKLVLEDEVEVGSGSDRERVRRNNLVLLRRATHVSENWSEHGSPGAPRSDIERNGSVSAERT